MMSPVILSRSLQFNLGMQLAALHVSTSRTMIAQGGCARVPFQVPGISSNFYDTLGGYRRQFGESPVRIHKLMTGGSRVSAIQEFWQRRHKGLETAEEWVWTCLTAIASHNARLNAIKELNPYAMGLAQTADRTYGQGAVGPLHGVPIVVKDNVAVQSDMHTTAGSLALAEAYATGEAFIVRKLRAAGAIILGKTNLTEWANFMADHMPNGYSALGGQVLNPYGPGVFDVGGSSSGSGAAVAAGMAPVAIGTETSGSILSPSSQNSLVGIKPTVGLVSRSGIIPIAYSQDTAGPMAKTVADAALVLSVLQGYDSADPVTAMAPGYPDYVRDLDPQGLRQVRIGVPRHIYWDDTTDEERALFEQALDLMRRHGATIIDPADIDTAGADWTYDVLLYEFRVAVNAYLAQWLQGAPRTLQEVIAFNSSHPAKALKYGQAVLIESEGTQGRLTDARYLRGRHQDLIWSRQEGIDRTLARHDLDALVFLGAKGADIAARAGYPSVTVPLGYTREGRPLAMTFTGSAFQEARLIRMAFAFEQASQARRDPQKPRLTV